jgi:hypothetical protein
LFPGGRWGCLEGGGRGDLLVISNVYVMVLKGSL